MIPAAASAVLWVLVALFAAASAFLLLLAAAALAGLSRRPGGRAGPRTRFAVIIPAHDEELLIGGLLDSVARQRYPATHFAVHVVADNCTDGTAAVARRHGANVHVRDDPARRGKGRALRWALERLRAAEVDAFVFVDADSRLSEDFLEVMDRHLGSQEASILQASYRVLEPASAPLVALRAMGFALMHDLRGRGKASLGLSCGLWGNGMVFARPVLTALGWRSFSAVEDAEQHIHVLLRGLRVRYAPHARVYGHMPATFAAARDQQRRWEGGRRSLIGRYWCPLAAATVRQRSAAPLVALIELAMPPLSVLATGGAALATVALVWGPPAAGALGIAGVAALLSYVAVGLLLSGLPPRTYLALVHVPRFIAWKTGLYGRELASRDQPAWKRTTRDSLG